MKKLYHRGSSAAPVINWRAFSLVLFVTLLTSLLWEATLGAPYGWWDYQHSQMMGIFVTAWNILPIEARVCLGGGFLRIRHRV